MKAMRKHGLAGLVCFILSTCAWSGFAENLTIQPLSDTVFMHQSSREVEGFGDVSGNGLIVVDGAKAYLIDTPWDRADIQVIQNWLDARALTLTGVVATHSHDDAGGNLDVFHQQQIPTWAHALTSQLLEEKGEAPATHAFTESVTVLPETVELFYPGPGHTFDNIVVWLPKQKLLFGGCFVRALETDSMGYTAEGDVQQWGDSVQRVLARYPNIQGVVPGHGKAGTVDMLIKTQRMARQAAADK